MSQNYNSGRRSRFGSNKKRNYSSKGRSQGGGRRGPKKAYIHPSKFVKAAKPPTVESYTPENKFSDFAMEQVIKDNLSKMGFVDPSPIQDVTIPVGLSGKDIVGIANTGTGKTAAFAIPVLNKIITDRNSKAIILAPTRELAQQIREQFLEISNGAKIESVLLIGGESMGKQLHQLKFKPRVIIGTPGRIKDHIERRTLKLDDCNMVVLDEVDRMLDMGFVHDITKILSNTSSERQGFYFSATLDDRVKGIIDNFSRNPEIISVKSTETSDHVEQNVVAYSSTSHKIDKLHDILISEQTTKVIIFDDTQRMVEKLSKELAGRGFRSDAIHGGRSQSQRRRVLKQFKSNEVTVLVATDVAARGIDVSDITHVINYSLPQSYDDYVHRIGRTGRAGKIGHALTFVEGQAETAY